MKVTLKAARTNAGLKQSEAAKAIGIHTNTYARWEKNPGRIPAEDQAKIEKVFKTKVENIDWTKA